MPSRLERKRGKKEEETKIKLLSGCDERTTNRTVLTTQIEITITERRKGRGNRKSGEKDRKKILSFE